MSLQVFVGHTGQIIDIDITRITTLELLKSYICDHSSILTARQVLLTIKGKSVRPQNLLVDKEVYVFDSGLISGSNNDEDSHIAHLALPDSADLVDAPDTLSNQNDLKSWQTLFQERLEWSVRQRDRCADWSIIAKQAVQEQIIIQRGLTVALQSLQLHLKAAEQKQRTALEWAEVLVEKQAANLQNWRNDWARLKELPARAELIALIQGSRKGDAVFGKEIKLSSYRPIQDVEQAANHVQAIATSFRTCISEMRSLLNSAQQQAEDLYRALDDMQAESTLGNDAESEKLLEEAEVVLRKIQSDQSYVCQLPKTPQSLSQASKMALLHTRNYLPNLREYLREMDDLLQRAVRQRNDAADTCLGHLQTLSTVESLLAKLYAAIKSLQVTPDDQVAFKTLDVVARLPFAYGSLLVECLRRESWTNVSKRNDGGSAMSATEVKIEEMRRRQHWLGAFADIIEPIHGDEKVAESAISSPKQPETWPSASPEEVQQYMLALKSTNTNKDLIDELSEAIRDLPPSMLTSSRKSKASVPVNIAETSGQTSSTDPSDNNRIKALEVANNRLQEELKGNKSRVRKLEDLLHRQATLTRANAGDLFSVGNETVAARPASPSLAPYRVSAEYVRPASRRTSSSHHGMEEKRLARRIVMLEGELQTQREQSAAMERDHQAQQKAHETGQVQIAEANSIKKDIMSNMEAQQREFSIERRTLESDLRQTRTRVEELEDELDRVLGSRDNERTGVSANTRTIENELQKARLDLHNVKSESTRDMEEIGQKLKMEQQKGAGLGIALEQSKGDVSRLELTLSAMRTNQDEEHEVLVRILEALGGEETFGNDNMTLTHKIVSLADRAMQHTKDLNDLLSILQADNKSLQDRLDMQNESLNGVQDKHDTLEQQLSFTRAQLDVAKARESSLEALLEDEHDQLRLLRTKFADGETGAEVLRQGAEEQEIKVADLSSKLTEARAACEALDHNMQVMQSDLSRAQSSIRSGDTRLANLANHAKQLSNRIYSQNKRLLRLLESLGFVVSSKNGQIAIDRASKISHGIIPGTDTDSSLNRSGDTDPTLSRSISFATPPRPRKTSVVDLTTSQLSATNDPAIPSEVLNWMDATSISLESEQFDAFMRILAQFPLEQFCETLSKRLRDFEYTARKFRLESRSASSKVDIIQRESASKLAVRDFKQGDLALFLPTKGKAAGAWAAFNINAPHHFLKEREHMALDRREWLVARITKVEERVVNLSRTIKNTEAEVDPSSAISSKLTKELADPASTEDNNPFDLSDGLTWYLVHAQEERSGPHIPSEPSKTAAPIIESEVTENESTTKTDENIKSAVTKDYRPKLTGQGLTSRRGSTTSKRSTTASVKGDPIPGSATAASPQLDLGTLPAQASMSYATSPPSSLLAGLVFGKSSNPVDVRGVPFNSSRSPASLVPHSLPAPAILTDFSSTQSSSLRSSNAVSAVDEAMASAMDSSIHLQPFKSSDVKPSTSSALSNQILSSRENKTSSDQTSILPSPNLSKTETKSMASLRENLESTRDRSKSPFKSPTKTKITNLSSPPRSSLNNTTTPNTSSNNPADAGLLRNKSRPKDGSTNDTIARKVNDKNGNEDTIELAVQKDKDRREREKQERKRSSLVGWKSLWSVDLGI